MPKNNPDTEFRRFVISSLVSTIASRLSARTYGFWILDHRGSHSGVQKFEAAEGLPDDIDDDGRARRLSAVPAGNLDGRIVLCTTTKGVVLFGYGTTWEKLEQPNTAKSW